MRRSIIAGPGLALVVVVAFVSCREITGPRGAARTPAVASGDVAPDSTSRVFTRRAYVGPDRAVPERYFGMHVHYEFDFTTGKRRNPWPLVGFGAWRLWDSGTSWLWLQPTDSTWRFAALDSIVDLAARRGVTLVLTLGATPAWASMRPAEPSPYRPGAAAPPKSIELWRAYVDTVTKRYRGRIAAYEVWNEPNMPDFFTGTPAEMVELAREAARLVRRNDPGARVLTPSPTAGLRGVRWLDDYLAAGGGTYADLVAFHFYVDPGAPEDMLPVLDSLRVVLKRYGVNKALWNTETGWYIPNTSGTAPKLSFVPNWLSPEQSISYVGRSLALGWCSGMNRFYWYAWDNGNMGMTEGDRRTPKPVARAYETMRRWLLGSTVSSCTRNARGVWTVVLSTESGARRAIFWSQDGVAPRDARIARPERWCMIQNALGEHLADAPLEIGMAPVLARPCKVASGPRSP